jgi:DNA helicase-2/ATP-dependent DNA helicase PcrA
VSALADAKGEIASNPRQQEAFEANGHCMVVAPPGSGKTMLLTARLAQDFLDEIAPPAGAACITYANAAADELRTRLGDLGVRRRANLFVGTVHGFALNMILRPYAPVVGRPEILEARVVDKATRKRIMDAAISQVYDEYENTFAVDTTVQRRRRHFGQNDDEDMFGSERIIEVERLYVEAMEDERLIDFDDMVRMAVELVQNHEFVRNALTARFPKLFVDEYQDLGSGLHHLVTSLCFSEDASATLFAVADPEQCIYVFTGATPELVEEVANRADVTDVPLEVNYRCADEIIRQSQTVLDRPIAVEGRRKGGTVEVHQVEGWISGQAAATLPPIEHAVSNDTPLDEIAIICPTNPACEEAADVVRAAGIPVFVRTSDQYAATSASTFLESLAEWASVPRSMAGFPLAELLRRWKVLLGDRWERQSSIDLVGYVLGITEPEQQPALEFVENFANMGLVESLSARIEGQESAASIEEMRANFGDAGSLEGLTIKGLGDRAKAKNRIHVVTMHGSKGLEFDHVFMLGLEGNRFPWWDAKDWEVIQARRQFYVSLTRARLSVRLYYTGWNEDRYGRRHENGPTRFIDQLDL